MRPTKLKTLFDYLPKSKTKAGDAQETGTYPFYTSSENLSKYLDTFQHEGGCLIFGTGGKACVHHSRSRFATSTDCIAVRPKQGKSIDAGYAYQYFRSNMQVLDDGFKGAGLKHISKAYLSEIQIPLPEDFDDQIRIAHLLGKVEGLIAQRKQHLQQLDDLLKSVFLKMFGDPVRNEKDWDKPALRAFGKISTGNTPPRNDPSNYDTSHIEWIKTDNIDADAVYVTAASEHLSETGAKRCRTVSAGALLVACIAGSLESIGRAALTDRKVAFNQQINAIQPAADVAPLFLYGLFKLTRRYIQSQASKGMKKILTKSDFEQITMIKPPFDRQQQFALIAERIERTKASHRHTLTDLETLYAALSQSAFKGELDLSRIPLPAPLGLISAAASACLDQHTTPL